jgi:hypothetical protein
MNYNMGYTHATYPFQTINNNNPYKFSVGPKIELSRVSRVQCSVRPKIERRFFCIQHVLIYISCYIQLSYVHPEWESRPTVLHKSRMGITTAVDTTTRLGSSENKLNLIASRLTLWVPLPKDGYPSFSVTRRTRDAHVMLFLVFFHIS